MPESGQKQNLLSKIQAGQAVIGIIGLGYMGLPLSLAYAEKGFRVLGFDVDPKKVEVLDRGECYISHMDPARVGRAVQSKRIVATADFSRLGEPDTLIICVPTPLTPQRDPDMS
jgi:UDP-N-acetyl-D-glucosamine dehydrogenase